MASIRPEELDGRLDDDGVFVLDVRPREEFHGGHVDGSRNVPVYGDLQRGDPEAFERVASVAPEDAEVVTVCKMGVVARRATAHLREEGHEARTLAGGMSAWRGYRDGALSYRLRSLLWDLRAVLPV